MIKNAKIGLFFFIVLFLVVGCGKDASNHAVIPKFELTISAAISLTDALAEIKTLYEHEHDVELTYILGGSGKLAQQIQQGAPVDVFISANKDWMDKLEDETLIIEETRLNIAHNNIVLITKKSSDIHYESFEAITAADVDQIAIGNPESVPAGKYTEQTLRHLHKWDELYDRFVFAKDVRQVLTYVETGNVDMGIAYESDALSSDQIRILASAADETHDPIIYPAAVTTDTDYEREAINFVEFLTTDQAQKILQKYGFKK